jgi:hypothetical protein
MITSPKSKIAIAAAFAIAVSSFFAAGASAAQFRTDSQRQGASSFAATPATGGGVVRRDPESCNNVASCNVMIAYCAATGGDFDVDPSGDDPEGRPGKGTCTWPD